MRKQQTDGRTGGAQVDRPTPAAVESERAVVGAVLENNALYETLADRLAEGAFHDPLMRRLWAKLPDMLAQGPVAVHDVAMLSESLPAGRKSDEDKAAARAQILDLVNHAAGTAFVDTHADRILEAWRRRRIRTLAQQADTRADDPNQDPADVLTDLAGQIEAIESGPGGGGILPAAVRGNAWEAEIPAREWLVRDWLPAGELCMLAGRGETGKSVLLLQIAAGLACDRERLNTCGGWLPGTSGCDVPALEKDPAPVVLANWEDSAAEALRRRERLHKYGGLAWAADPSINARLHCLPMRGFGPVWAPGGTGHISTVGRLTQQGYALRRYCQRVGARLLVLDPASLALSIEENSRPLVSLALESWAGWASESGCSVMLTGHPAKATEGEGADYSGTTAWRGLVRALWTLKHPDKEAEATTLETERRATLTLNKANYAMSGQVLNLQTVGKRAAWKITEESATGWQSGSARIRIPKDRLLTRWRIGRKPGRTCSRLPMRIRDP